MSDVLEEICSRKKEHIAAQKQAAPLSTLRQKVATASPPRGFLQALKGKTLHKQTALIAEIKKASPSRGLIRTDFDPPALARAYASGGATCLSILTDEPYFQGRNEFLRMVRDEDEINLPLLRKDFMLDPYQIVESRAIGADCILLIMAALADSQARELEKAAHEMGMDVLVEVHDTAELERALTQLSSPLIGINNRNLKTLKVDINNSINLVKEIPAGYITVCESGISSHADIELMQQSGIYCFLVGESLMRQDDVTQATKLLLGTATAAD